MKNIFTALLLLVNIIVSSQCYAVSKQVIGWIEPVSLENDAIIVVAKIDTGADGSSLNATDIKKFIKDGNEWVSFILTNGNNEKHTIRKLVDSYTRVKRKGAESQERPVILLDICLGSTRKQMRVNLTDRSTFKYRMLIGRRFLKDSFVVDPSVKHTTTPGCKR